MLSKLRPRMRRRLSDPANRNALLFTASSLIASCLNYVYYPAMSRFIRVDDFGELQVVTSLIMQLNTALVGLILVNVNLIANNDRDVSLAMVVAFQRVAFWLSVAACTALAVATGPLMGYFHISSPVPLLLISPILLLQVVSSFWVSYLQGHRDFVGISAYGIASSGGKLFFSVGLAILGFGVIGGIAGITLSAVFGLMITRHAARRRLPRLRQALLWPGRRERAYVRGHLTYMTEVIVALVATSIFLSIDTLLVKHLFPSHFAGQYAGVSTVARIIFSAAAPLVTVMLPSISLLDPMGARRAFRRTMAITAAICAGGVACTTLFSAPIITILLGPEFTPLGGLLPILSLVASLVAITNVMVNYLLALRSHGSVAVSLVSLIVALPLVLAFHATVFQIVISTSAGLLAGQTVFCVVFALLLRRNDRPRSSAHEPTFTVHDFREADASVTEARPS